MFGRRIRRLASEYRGTSTTCHDRLKTFSTATVPHERLATFGFENIPESEKRRRVEEVFGGVANSYDLMNDLMSGGLHRLWKNSLVAKLFAFPGMEHVDVAGGTGDVAERVRLAIDKACEDRASSLDDPVLQERGEVTVCDVNQAMLEEGKRRKGEFLLCILQNKLREEVDVSEGLIDGCRLRARWILGDAEQLPLRDASMDSYTIAFGIRNVTKIQTALEEANRVLKPGGRFLCLEFSHVALPGLKQLYDAYSFNVIPRIGRIVAKDENSYRYLVESIRRFPKQVEFAAMLREAGFQTVTYENLSAGIVAIHSGFK